MKKKLLSLDDHPILLEAFDSGDQALKDLIHDRIQANVELDPNTSCMIYTGFWEAGSGQAKIRIGARIYPLCRAAAWVYLPGFRLWGKNLAVRTCDSPACANPEHLVVAADRSEAIRLQRSAGRLGSAIERLARGQATEEDLRVLDSEVEGV